MVSCFFCPRTLKGDDKVANPHFEIKITKRSKRQSAVAGAAYQSGENLFSEYDQKHKDYRKKEGVVYTEVMLPSHPPGHNPHCHIMLTMRAIDENGKWLPKSRKVYDLDENGERIRPPSGNRKNHKEDKSYYRHFTVIILQNHIDAPTLPRYPLFQILLTKVVVLTVITTTFSG